MLKIHKITQTQKIYYLDFFLLFAFFFGIFRKARKKRVKNDNTLELRLVNEHNTQVWFNT